MNLNKMKCFVDVVKYNSFTKAARANYISQTAISQQIASMEEELGFKLFIRNKKGIIITEAGKSFYESSISILSTYARSVSMANCIDQGLSGNIVLGISPGLDINHIYKVINELIKRFPDVHIMIRVGPPVELWHMLRSSELTLTVALPYDFYNIAIPDIAIEPLLTCGYELFVSKDNPLASLDEVSLCNIENEKFAVMGESIGELTYSHIVTEQMQNNHKLIPRISVSNYETLKMIVATNQGVAILPEYNNTMDSSSIQKLKLLDYPETVTYSLMWRPKIASPGLFNFVDIMKNYFRGLSEKEDAIM